MAVGKQPKTAFEFKRNGEGLPGARAVDKGEGGVPGIEKSQTSNEDTLDLPKLVLFM